MRELTTNEKKIIASLLCYKESGKIGGEQTFLTNQQLIISGNLGQHGGNLEQKEWESYKDICERIVALTMDWVTLTELSKKVGRSVNT